MDIVVVVYSVLVFIASLIILGLRDDTIGIKPKPPLSLALLWPLIVLKYMFYIVKEDIPEAHRYLKND